MTDRNDKILLNDIPETPGVYQFFDKERNVIYVGKAKNLKKRIVSYFQKVSYENNKLKLLVNKIYELKYIIVNSESDALLLENNLIKKYKPRYNVLLKDDKTFPWICIKNERFPRVFYTRNYLKDGSYYFGPYTSVLMVKAILDLVKKLYPLRNCNHDLSENKINSKIYKPCLEYHIGNCKAPCIAKQSNEEYLTNIGNIKEILKGNISEIIKYLKNQMNIFSENYEFENAQNIKEKINLIKNYQSKSAIVNSSINNVDVFSIVQLENDVCVNYLRIARGSIIQVHSLYITKKLNEPLSELLSISIIDIRQKMLSNSNEIISNLLPDVKLPGIKYTIKPKGDKLKILELSERNAKLFLNAKQKLSLIKAKKIQTNKNVILENLRTDLRLITTPFHIECFDNSNIQGANPVAACVVFKNGKPSIKDYRHYNIKSVSGPNDFASMKEIIFRRYRRILAENEVLPDLIVIDGGQGQLNAAIESLKELNIAEKISVIGIAKKLEEIYYPYDPIPLYIDKNSSSLKIIQYLRNEAHRFGINFHRLKRSGDQIKSTLDNISGVGIITKTKLFKNFKSIDNIIKTSEYELSKIVGKAKAKKIKELITNNI